MAFSKELEAIIEAALADGVITEKERAVLHKKALLEGVDPDEVDVVIDGRLQQIQKSIDDAKQKVRKCPSCGEIIPAMTAVCPSCGQVIDASNADNKALAVYMDKLEASLVKLKENGASKYNNKVKAELESMIRQGRAMYGDNKKIAYLISEVEASIAKFDKSHKNQFIAKIVGAILAVLILVGWGVKCSSDISANNEKEKENAEVLKAQAQAQCDSLCNLIDKLPVPTYDNCEEVTHELLKITWTMPIGDRYQKDDWSGKRIANPLAEIKDSFIEKKKQFANQIKSAYHNLWVKERYQKGSNYWGNRYKNKKTGAVSEDIPIPDEIRFPDMYIKN